MAIEFPQHNPPPDQTSPTPTRRPTLGEHRVRLDFNPSGEGVVYDVKRHTAAIIDLVQLIKINNPDGEVARCCALAMTAYEEAAMWAVKAATARV
jgi:hypothetical protein